MSELSVGELSDVIRDVVEDVVGDAIGGGEGSEDGDILEPDADADEESFDLDGGDDDEELININEDRLKRSASRRRQRLSDLRESRRLSRPSRRDNTRLRNRSRLGSEAFDEGERRRRPSEIRSRRSRSSSRLSESRRPSRKRLDERRGFYGISTPEVLGRSSYRGEDADLRDVKLQYLNRVVKDFSLDEAQQSQVFRAFSKAYTRKALDEAYQNVIGSLTAKGGSADDNFSTSLASRPLGTGFKKPEQVDRRLEEVRKMQRIAGILKD